MKISRFYNLFTIANTLFLIIVSIVVFRALSIHDEVIRSEQHRFNSFLLATELFQSSENLTRMACTYVSTGDPIYEKRYFEILDIRNGKKPRPEHYSLTYWHLSGVDRDLAVAQGETVSLQELMRREGFAEHEYNLLRESQGKSDRLIKIEKQAFAAMKGLYEDSRGNFTIHRKPDRSYAINLLYSEKYLNEKARIMAPIQQFIDENNMRTQAQLNDLQARLYRHNLLALVLIIISLFGMAVKYIHTFSRILQPLENLRRQVADIALGNYTARCDVTSIDEIGELCRHFNSMADCIEQDILRHEEDEERIRHMAQHDTLTGLANRALFDDRLHQAITIARRDRTDMALMCLDLDRFKPVNDNFGHGVGDMLLKAAAQRMQDCVRESDTVARIGGDEFVVLLSSISKDDDALVVAEKIRHALNRPFELDGLTLSISSSIGISIYPKHGRDGIELTRNADSALYSAKESGRDNVKLFRFDQKAANQGRDI